jgi:hypothetical protein
MPRVTVDNTVTSNTVEADTMLWTTADIQRESRKSAVSLTADIGDVCYVHATCDVRDVCVSQSP